MLKIHRQTELCPVIEEVFYFELEQLKLLLLLKYVRTECDECGEQSFRTGKKWGTCRRARASYINPNDLQYDLVATTCTCILANGQKGKLQISKTSFKLIIRLYHTTSCQLLRNFSPLHACKRFAKDYNTTLY